MMLRKLLLSLCLLPLVAGWSGRVAAQSNGTDTAAAGRLTVGGYSEAVYQRFFYSDDFNRYTYPENYSSGFDRGSTDLPHVVFFMSYDFGRGWKVSSEIEFEHGGTGSAVEIEAEEFGEYEQEVEKGGEVALEQFWIEKRFADALHLRMGHFVVPVGATNNRHFPTEYFTVLRPEGESTILPLTWHQTGISLWGTISHWRYELQLIGGLDADRFGSANWIKLGATSPYEFKLATDVATALRIDNFSFPGLRLSVSGYYGQSSSNSLKAERYSGLMGDVAIGSFDSEYNRHNVIARANFVYGHLGNSAEISKINKSLPALAPSPHTDVASDAMCWSAEAGYNIMSWFTATESLYPFLRYEYYNSMENTVAGMLADARYKRSLITAGINYMPIPQLVIKAGYSARMFDSPYNTENTVSFGVMYTGMFY